jgi:hypothetical protein
VRSACAAAAAGGWKAHEGHEEDPHDKEHKIKVGALPALIKTHEHVVHAACCLPAVGYHDSRAVPAAPRVCRLA